MVGKAGICGALLIHCTAFPVAAESPRDRMFPTDRTCYARVYSAAHLDSHPEQYVSSIALVPEAGRTGDPLLALWVTVALRDRTTDPALALSHCENNGTDTLYCGLEGDAGGFTVTPANNGAVLVRVSSLGMSFERSDGFFTLRDDRGDDRSFLLQPTPDCR